MPRSSVSHPSRKSSPAHRFHGPVRTGKLSGADVLMVFAGLALLAGVGYVGYRTQVRGDSIDKVFPFLAAKPAQAAVETPAVQPATRKVAPYTPPPVATTAQTKPAGTNTTVSGGGTAPSAPTATDRATSKDTPFGRHYDPTQTADTEYGEQTIFGRSVKKKAPTQPVAKEPAKDSKTAPATEPAK